ncbi:MAG: HEPN domain-containing protein [Candidatus Aenigmatarchaeota archaeon]
MKDKSISEWIEKADTDLRVAKKLFELEEAAWIIAFHSQQAVEKFLKAFLIKNNVKFRKTHDIKELLDLCIQIDKDFEKLKELGIEYLTEYATDIKYPGFYEPSMEEAKEAIEIAEKVKEFVLNKLKEKGLE